MEKNSPMNKKSMIILLVGLAFLLAGCSLVTAGTSTPQPTLITIPSPTLAVASLTPSITLPATVPTPLPTLTSTVSVPPPAATATTVSGGGGAVILPGSPSGPYATLMVAPSDVLNIRSGPGVGYAVSANLAATATNIMRTGPSSSVDGDLWVEVLKPGGGTGWVNSYFLTEYIPPATFCASTSVNTFIANLDTALTTRNGTQLSGLVSPAHGMTVYLWRYGNPVTFMANDALWVFDTTYEHRWGEAPGSGLATNGSFHSAVLPFLQEVFNASYSLTCNSLGTAAQYGSEPWPLLYTNVNYYTVLKPGTPGIDLDFRYFLVGVEFVQGQPYVFALIHFAWEP